MINLWSSNKISPYSTESLNLLDFRHWYKKFQCKIFFFHQEGLHVCEPSGPVKHTKFCSRSVSMDLKGLGTDHLTWCWGMEKKHLEKNCKQWHNIFVPETSQLTDWMGLGANSVTMAVKEYDNETVFYFSKTIYVYLAGFKYFLLGLDWWYLH